MLFDERVMLLYSYTKEMIFEGEPISVKACISPKKGEKSHTHEFLEFVYITAGEGVHFIDGVKHSVAEGDLLFINYGQAHSIEPSESMHFVNILLEPSFLSDTLIDAESVVSLFQSSLFEEFYGADCDYTRQCVSFYGGEKEDNDRLIKTMISEFGSKHIGYRSVLRSCMTILFTRLMRKISGRNIPADAGDSDCINEVLAYIDENCTNKISLEKLAAESFYNPSYFGRILKERCGKSFTAYVKEKRLEKAAGLLRTEKCSVDRVMGLTGYNDKKLFYRHFREAYGMTPSEYRAEFNGGKDNEK